jgi:hypothetical protein
MNARRIPPIYTEQESAAIIQAEMEGKPHPFPEKEAQRVGTPAWLEQCTRDAAQREAKAEENKVYQLGLWPDDKRAMPGEFIACALFSALQDKDITHLTRAKLASANGLAVTYTGVRLTQVHADVWEAIMHLSRQKPEGSLVYFRSRQLLRLMGRHVGKSQRDQLKQWLAELTATCVEIVDTDKHRRYWGSLLPRGADKVDGDDTLYAVEINRDLAKVFDSGFALVDWEQRQKLRGKWLALWLQRRVSRFTKPVLLAELQQLSGSTSSLREFRRLLKKALADLETVGVIATWRIDAATDTVYVALPGKRSQGGLPTHAPGASDPRFALPAPGQASLPLALIPAVNAETRAKFHELYPSKDVDRCLADFASWLSRSGKTADRPNGAFLGFAKKWEARS